MATDRPDPRRGACGPPGLARHARARRATPLWRGRAAAPSCRRLPAPVSLVVALVVTLAMATATAAADAPAEKLAVKRLFPPGGAAGSTVVVKAEGTFPRWPARAWTDREGTVWKPLEEKGSFAVTIAAEGSLGVHRVRIHDDEAAVAVRRFVVGRGPEILEAEPNDRPREPQPLSTLPVTVNGLLEKGGDVDGFGVDLAAGQTLVAAVDAHGGPAAPVDAVLEIVDERGGYLARNLDARGLDPRIVFTAPRAGLYVVRVYGFPAAPDSTIGLAGGAEHVYRLCLTTGGFLAATLPAAVARSGPTTVAASGWNLPADLAPLSIAPAAAGPATMASGTVATVWAGFAGVAGAVELPVVTAPRLALAAAGDPAQANAPAVEPPFVSSGVFTAPRQTFVTRVAARKGQALLVAVEATAAGSEAEAVLEIRAADGRVLLARSDRDPAAAWTPPADGDHAFVVADRRGGFGPGHFHRLVVVPSEPGLEAAGDADALTGTIGGTVDLPIAVERLRGWKEPVEFALDDPPPGITAEPVSSAAEGDTAKKVTLVIKAGAAYAGPIAVAVRRLPAAAAEPAAAADEAASRAAPVAAVRFGREKLPSVWLTVPPAKPADQPAQREKPAQPEQGAAS